MLIHLFVSFILWRKHVRKQYNIQFFIFHLEETQINVAKKLDLLQSIYYVIKIFSSFWIWSLKKVGTGKCKRL